MDIYEFGGTIRFLADTTLKIWVTRPSHSENSLAWEQEEEATFPRGTELEVYFRGSPLVFEGSRKFQDERLDINSLISALYSGSAEIASSCYFSDSDLLSDALEILDRKKIGEDVLAGAKVIWVDFNSFAFLRDGTVHVFDSDTWYGFDPVEYGTMEEFFSGPGEDLEEFSGYIHFIKETTLSIRYTWHCGDGCCSGEERIDERFHQGEEIKVRKGWLPLQCDLSDREDERLDPKQIFLALLDRDVELRRR